MGGDRVLPCNAWGRYQPVDWIYRRRHCPYLVGVFLSSHLSAKWLTLCVYGHRSDIGFQLLILSIALLTFQLVSFVWLRFSVSYGVNWGVLPISISLLTFFNNYNNNNNKSQGAETVTLYFCAGCNQSAGPWCCRRIVLRYAVYTACLLNELLPVVMDTLRFVDLPLDVSICIIQRILFNLYIVELEGIISCIGGELQAKLINNCACIYISNMNGKFMYKIIGQMQNYFIIAIEIICLYFVILFYIELLFYIYVHVY